MVPWIELGQDFGTSLEIVLSMSTFVLSIIFTWCSGCSHLTPAPMFRVLLNLEFPCCPSLQRHVLVLCPPQGWPWGTGEGSCTLSKTPQEAKISVRTSTGTFKTPLKQTLEMPPDSRTPIPENERWFPAVFSSICKESEYFFSNY